MFDTCKSVAAFSLAMLFAISCSSETEVAEGEGTPESPSTAIPDVSAPADDGGADDQLGPPAPLPEEKTAEDYPDLVLTTKVEGEGEGITKGQTGKFHYTGVLLDGTQFDSSLTRGQPFEVTIGTSRVIQGWHLGLVGMKVGERRSMRIPPDLAYGDRPSGKIPANSTLVFDVELVEIVE